MLKGQRKWGEHYSHGGKCVFTCRWLFNALCAQQVLRLKLLCMGMCTNVVCTNVVQSVSPKCNCLINLPLLSLCGASKKQHSCIQNLIWCAILPVQPPLLPVWTHHIADYWLSYKREEKKTQKTIKYVVCCKYVSYGSSRFYPQCFTHEIIRHEHLWWRKWGEKMPERTHKCWWKRRQTLMPTILPMCNLCF